MMRSEKVLAIQELNDIQRQIEALEDSWQNADEEKRNEIDKELDLLLARRHGMQALMDILGIEFSRRDRVERKGFKYTPRTTWLLD